MLNGHDRDTHQPDEPDTPDVEWRCRKCNALLGYVEVPRLDVVRMKWRELYVYVGDPLWIRTICRSCGTENQLHDEVRLAARAERLKADKAFPGDDAVGERALQP